MCELNKGNGQATCARALARLALLALCALAVQAKADGTWDDCVRSGGGPDYYQQFPETTVYLGRDTAVGTPVGPWLMAAPKPGWTCTRRQGYGGTSVQLSVQGYPPYTRLGTLSHDGQTYSYYRLGDTSPALAYIVRWRAIVDGVSTQWTPLNVATGIYQDSASTLNVVKNAGQTYDIQVETQIRLVKRTAALNPQSVQNIADLIYVRHKQQVGGTTSQGTGTYRISQMRKGVITFAGGGTCTTPDVPVTLPPVIAGSFDGEGSVKGTTPFNLEFKNCPLGLYSIGYYFSATTPVLDATKGVVALDGSSTASGVGVQLTQDNGTALRFGQANTYPLVYDASIVSSYQIPLKASYYQTGSTVGSGSVSTAVTFTLDYQ